MKHLTRKVGEQSVGFFVVACETDGPHTMEKYTTALSFSAKRHGQIHVQLRQLRGIFRGGDFKSLKLVVAGEGFEPSTFGL